MSFPSSIKIREVGPREGFQTSRKVIPTEKKLELISKLNETGVKFIEITSFVRPDKVPQMADASEVARLFEKRDGIAYSGLYLNQKGFEQAQKSGRLDNEAWLYTAGSATFLNKNSNTSYDQIRSELGDWLQMFAAAKVTPYKLMVSTAFACGYEGVIPLTKLVAAVDSVTDELKKHGHTFEEICLADTIGWATPEQVKSAVEEMRSRFKGSEISLHLHDTRGMGLANAYAGLQVGVTTFDSSVGGIGGCPFASGAAGNIATEELVYLCQELGIKTGIDIAKYVAAAKIAESILGEPLQGKLYRAWQCA